MLYKSFDIFHYFIMQHVTSLLKIGVLSFELFIKDKGNLICKDEKQTLNIL